MTTIERGGGSSSREVFFSVPKLVVVISLSFPFTDPAGILGIKRNRPTLSGSKFSPCGASPPRVKVTPLHLSFPPR